MGKMSQRPGKELAALEIVAVVMKGEERREEKGIVVMVRRKSVEVVLSTRGLDESKSI